MIAWTVLVPFGAREIYGYSTTPGPRGGTPEQWPARSTFARSNTATVIMFLHPECPCSRASLAELARLETRGAAVHVAVTGIGELWDRAGKLDVTRRLDPGGLEASRFGAATSGHVVVYDARGTLRFSGGITGSRGHAGYNVGRQTVQKILDGESLIASNGVFGCGL